MTKTEVINKLKPIINNLADKHRWLVGKKSLALAQVIIESGWLKHARGNNCLGIKVPKSKIGVWKNVQLLWTSEWVNGKYVRVQCWFMTYPSIEACIESGYIKVLSLSRYKQTRESIDWWDATNYIRINGYATSPSYSNTLRKAILGNKLYEIDFRHEPDSQITEDFKYKETFSNVRIGNKTYYRVIETPPKYDENRLNLMTQYQIGRDYIGKPFIITPKGCVYRIDEYNVQTGGSSKSQHKTANGGDVYTPRGITTWEFYKIMTNKTTIKGVGYDGNWLHLDARKVKAFWHC